MLGKTTLQYCLSLAVLVPIVAGAAGIVSGPGMMGAGVTQADVSFLSDLDSHYRYLSGLLLAIGLAFAASIARVERHGGRIRLLAAIVVVGGLGRLVAVVSSGHASPVTIFALAMELFVTPGLAFWQSRVAMPPGRFSG